jgi:hypothetical protein
MSTPVITKPDLRAVLLDALEDAYWGHRAEIESCRDCRRNPAGICPDHQADNDAAFDYDEARKQLQRTPECPEVLAVLAEGGEQ